MTAVVTAVAFTGLIFHPLAVPLGSAAVGAALLGWFWPTHAPKPIHHPAKEAKQP